jgi:anaerobic selenocysteine-containing dehydrogenase
MGVVHDSQGMLKPASKHLKSEVAIIAGIAEATLGDRSTVDWSALRDDYNRVREHISRVIPGCENYSERVRGAGFYLPNGPREGTFTTDTKRAKFTVHPIPERPLAKGQYIMMTIRTHDQFNTVVYGLDDRYRGILNERRVIMMNAEDMAEAGINKGDVLDLTGHFNGETRVAERFIAVPYPIPRRCTATYFPETNVLVPLGSTAEKSNTPVSKYVVITVAPSRYEGDFDPSYQRGKAAEPQARPPGANA